MFTYHYAQPEAYRFSLDSIRLASFVASQLQSRPNLDELRILDLCAGCGVIGLELTWHLPQIRQFDFIEVQDIYTPFFYENIAIVNRPELQLRWHVMNYDKLLENTWAQKFDVVISNPPYFQPNQGVLSSSEFKNRCRFFLDSTFANFIRGLTHTLVSGGEAYFLLRPLEQHKCDLFSQISEFVPNEKVSVEKIFNIRGTDVILLKKC
jgi:tRNA1(Val) A37 N6-methylase TrmN6